MMWPNIAALDRIFRRHDEQGRTALGTVQMMPAEASVHALNARQRR